MSPCIFGHCHVSSSLLLTFLLIRSSSYEWVTIATFFSKPVVAVPNLWVACGVSCIFNISAALVLWKSMCESRICRHCPDDQCSLLQFPFYSPPSHVPFVPLDWLFLIFLFLSFCIEKGNLQCCVGMNSLLQFYLTLSLSPNLFLCLHAQNICTQVHQTCKYLHQIAPPELIQASRDGGAVLNRLKRVCFQINSLVRWTIGFMLRWDEAEDR